MKDQDKTKEELINELEEMRQRIAELEESLVTLEPQEATRTPGMLPASPDRKVAEAEPADTKERLAHILSSNPAVIYTAKPDGDYGATFVSDNITGQLGYEPREFLEDSSFWASHIHPEDAPRIFAELSPLFERGQLILEYRFLHKDGTYRWMRDEMNLARDENGIPVEITGYRIDITERKQAEEALRETEERLQLALRGADIGLWDWDLRTGKVTRDERTAAIYGYPSAEMDPSPEMWESVIHPADKPEVLDKFNECLEGSTPSYEAEYRLSTKSGETKWVLARGKVSERDRDGKPLRVSGTLLDITDRKQAEEALRNAHDDLERQVEERTSELLRANEKLTWNEALLNCMANSSPLAYFVVDNRTEDILYFNDRFCEMWGLERLADQMQQKILKNRDIFLESVPLVANPESFVATCKRILSEEERSAIEDEIEFVDGRTIRRFSTQLRDEADRYFGRFYIFEDVTSGKRSEQLELEAARFRAVADLAGGVAHNFNNLLQIFIGNLELALIDLEMGSYTDVRDSLEKVLERSKFGAETVRRLQSFAGIRDHSQVPQRGVFDLSGIVRQAVEMSKTWWKTIPEKQGRKVSLDIHLQDGCLVQGEKNELFEVVVNLIKNATEALAQDGAVDVETRVEGNRVILKVRDTGVGISEQNLKRLFNPFFTTKVSAGSGLGLASSRKIIEDCGGNILVDSKEGRGTTLTVVLPLVKEEPKPPETEKTLATGQQLTVLAIDDEEAMLDLLKNALSRHNCEVFTALCGEKGLDIFKKNVVDLVICDLGMPGINGWEVGKRIRAICQEQGIKKTPFILLTGWGGQKTEEEKMTESGVDVVMEKPLKIKNMLEVVREVVEKSLSRDSEA